jgi:subtilase family serine protease
VNKQNKTKGKSMNNKFNELAKGMAEPATRGRALKKLGVGLIGMALTLGAWAQHFHPLCGWVSSTPPQPGARVASYAPDGTVFYNVLHSYAPTNIYAAYGVDALHNEGWTGAGQTIIIVDSYGSPTALQDLQTFSATFGLPGPDLTIVYPDGQPTLNSADKLSWAVETSLDLQWAHAIAPDAKLVLIALNRLTDSGDGGEPALFRGIQYAITNYPSSPISQSFGAAEQAFASPTKLLHQYESVYQAAVAAGFTPLASAGDTGSANTVAQFNGPESSEFVPYPTVLWPASSPSVTAVGGTWLQYQWRWDPHTNWAALVAAAAVDPRPIADENPVAAAYLNWDDNNDRVEANWREDFPVFALGHGISGGGGLSAVFPTPSWQASLSASLTQGARAMPDLSWNATRDGGVLVYCTPAGGWQDASGTSCGSPQIAGLVALVNQIRARMGKGPIGHVASKLYQLPSSDFNDIVPQTFGTGADAVTIQDNMSYGSGVPGFQTTVSYDLTTGLGSPKAYSFVHDLATMFP